MPLKRITFELDLLNLVVRNSTRPGPRISESSISRIIFRNELFGDPIPLVDSLNVLKSKCSILEMKILRKIQNLDTKSFI